jgi:hypothetical protein
MNNIKKRKTMNSFVNASDRVQKKQKANAEAKAKSNAEAKAKSNAEAKAKANAEAKAKANAEAKAKANAEARARANAEARARANAEARARANNKAKTNVKRQENIRKAAEGAAVAAKGKIAREAKKAATNRNNTFRTKGLSKLGFNKAEERRATLAAKKEAKKLPPLNG